MQTIFTVATGIEIHIHTKKAEHLNKTVFKRQIMLFKLLALMELALTVTLSKSCFDKLIYMHKANIYSTSNAFIRHN